MRTHFLMMREPIQTALPDPAPVGDGPFTSYPAGGKLKLPVINGVRNEDFPVVSRFESLKVLNDDLDFANKPKDTSWLPLLQGKI